MPVVLALRPRRGVILAEAMMSCLSFLPVVFSVRAARGCSALQPAAMCCSRWYSVAALRLQLGHRCCRSCSSGASGSPHTRLVGSSRPMWSELRHHTACASRRMRSSLVLSAPSPPSAAHVAAAGRNGTSAARPPCVQRQGALSLDESGRRLCWAARRIKRRWIIHPTQLAIAS